MSAPRFFTDGCAGVAELLRRTLSLLRSSILNRLSLASSLLLFTAGCAGSTSFVGTCPDGGLDNSCDKPSLTRPELSLARGASGQVGLTLLVEGAHVGTFDFSVAPQNSAPLSATVSPTTADLKDGVPQPLIVTVTVNADAAPADAASVFVTAKPRGGSDKDGAGRAVFVKISAP